MRLREWARDHGLLIANLALFAVFFVGMAFTGWQQHNDDQLSHGQSALALGAYLASGAKPVAAPRFETGA